MPCLLRVAHSVLQFDHLHSPEPHAHFRKLCLACPLLPMSGARAQWPEDSSHCLAGRTDLPRAFHGCTGMEGDEEHATSTGVIRHRRDLQSPGRLRWASAMEVAAWARAATATAKHIDGRASHIEVAVICSLKGSCPAARTTAKMSSKEFGWVWLRTIECS